MRRTARHKARIGILDRLTILLLVYTSFCDSVKAEVWSSGWAPVAVTALAAIGLLALTMTSVWLISSALGFERGERITALFCGSKKTLASGVPMARVIFGAAPGLGLILLPIMLYHPIQLVVGGWLAERFGSKQD